MLTDARKPQVLTTSWQTMTRAALLGSTILCGTGVAFGQTAEQAAEASSGRDTVVVTAQRRSEDIQDVPITVLAFPTEKLEQLQVSDFSNYAQFIPSLSYQSTGPNSTNVYFRGVVSGGDGNHSASQPSVGVYFNDQPVTTILGFLPLHIYDIERVEAIAGPQGTLFGAGAESGVLRIISNKPDTSGFEAGYDLEVNQIDHGGTGAQVEGFLNQPLSDNTAVRLVGYYKKDAGYIDNVLGSRTFPTSGITVTNADQVQKDFNTVETYGARAALRIDLNDSWTITPSLMAQKTSVNGIGAFDPKLGDLKVERFEPDFSDDRILQAALSVEGKIGNFDLVYSSSYLDRKITSANDYTDYAYYYDTLFGYGAYFVDDSNVPVDPTQFYLGEDDFTLYSNELRISSPADEPLRFVAGLFQNHQEHNIHQQYIIRNIGTAIEVSGHPDTIWLTEQKRTDRDYAVFGEVTYDFTPELSATAGVRLYSYDNSLIGFFGYGAGFSSGTGEAACFGPPVVAGSPCTNLDRTVKDEGATYRANVSYHLDPDKMIYATYSTGFRPGGVNRRGTLPPYLADELVNYEIGAKTTWFDNSLTFNIAAFTQDWNDFQFPILGQNGLTEIQNASSARIQGIEGDFAWYPIDGLTISGAFSALDSKLTSNFCGFVDVNLTPETNCPQAVDNPATNGDETQNPEAPSGQRLPVVPEFKGTLTARYEFPFMDFDAHFQGSVSGQTDSRSSLLVADQAILGDQKGFITLDLTTGIAQDNWSLTAFLTNATDERADAYNFVACAIGTCGAHAFQGTNQPRTLGIKWGQKF